MGFCGGDEMGVVFFLANFGSKTLSNCGELRLSVYSACFEILNISLEIG